MTDADPLDNVRRDLQYLKDRLAILDCISTLSRGTDRHDVDQMTNAFHPDGWDHHGNTVVAGPEFGESMNATHAAGSQQTMHNITTHTCEIDGDVAHAESYVMGAILNRDGVTRVCSAVAISTASNAATASGGSRYGVPPSRWR